MNKSAPPPIIGNQPPRLPSGQPPQLPQKPKSELTRTGTILVLLTAPVTLAFAFFLPFWLFPRILSPGTHYPALMIAIPTILFGAFFFLSLAWITEKLGFPATKPKKNNSDDKNHVV